MNTSKTFHVLAMATTLSEPLNSECPVSDVLAVEQPSPLNLKSIHNDPIEELLEFMEWKVEHRKKK